MSPICVKKVCFRPRTRLFFILSLFWVLVTANLLEPLLNGVFRASKPMEALGWLLVAAHPCLIAMAVYFRITETPHRVMRRIPSIRYPQDS